MSTSNDHLVTAQLAIYAFLVIPSHYLIFKHGWHGLLGFFYLNSFVLLRLIGAAIFKSQGSTSFAANLISNIGLSPLLLAACGILGEACHYRNNSQTRKQEWILILIFHFIVLMGIALLATGASGLNSKTPTKSDTTLLKVGVVILLVAWVALCGWVGASARGSGGYVGEKWRQGSVLLYATILSLPFIGIRLLYAVVSFLDPTKNLSLTHADIGLKIGLSFLPELVAALVLMGAGMVTRDVRRLREEEGVVVRESVGRRDKGGKWGAGSGEEGVGGV